MQSPLLKRIVSLEYLFAAVLVIVFYIVVGGFAWYWLIILFIVFDISAIGYLFNPKIGAIGYNTVHSLIGPVLFMIIYIATTNQVILFVTLLWLYHIFVDRALGFGLKHSSSFNHTHLGTIGRAKKK